MGVKGFSWILYSCILPLLFLLCLQTVFCPQLFTIHPALDPHIGWVILVQSRAPSIELKLWPFFAFHYGNILNISVVTDLFFLGEVPTMFFILSFNNDLKEYLAHGASPGVVVIFTCPFNWALRCLIR